MHSRRGGARQVRRDMNKQTAPADGEQINSIIVFRAYWRCKLTRKWLEMGRADERIQQATQPEKNRFYRIVFDSTHLAVVAQVAAAVVQQQMARG